MNMQRTAVLIEVSSIQQYIFSSNKLKENIGASYIIEKLLYGDDGLMDKILKETFGNDFNINLWKEARDLDKTSVCEVGYVGGGNTLLFFRDEQRAKDFIRKFSKACLLEFPTLKITFGIKHDFDLSAYKISYQLLLKDLKSRKSGFIPLVSIPKHGITADCPWSNEISEVFESKSRTYISIASAAKLRAVDTCLSRQNDTYKCLEGKYILPIEIENLGQTSEASYMAVVHVDGNGMGKIFADINDLKELRKKSLSVSEKAHSAMEKLIAHCICLCDEKKLTALNLKDNTLPIRPILVGGDDITFICEGKLGIYLAEKFIEYFYDKTERSKKQTSPDKLMDGACAGVVIVKTHFPFYKAVKLAEELCAEAKVESRRNPGFSYISYYYSATTFSGDIHELRKKTHNALSGNMYYGPYLLFEENNAQSLEKLKEGIRLFKGLISCNFPQNPLTINKWPKNKVMQLREIIADSASAQKLFEKEISEIGLRLPFNKATIWEKRQTAYFDQIELMDFYLDTLL